MTSYLMKNDGSIMDSMPLGTPVWLVDDKTVSVFPDRGRTCAGVCHGITPEGLVLVAAQAPTTTSIGQAFAETLTGKDLDQFGEMFIGIKRANGEPDSFYRDRLKIRLLGVTPRAPKTPAEPAIKRLKYPGECPCGSHGPSCDYHKDVHL